MHRSRTRTAVAGLTVLLATALLACGSDQAAEAPEPEPSGGDPVEPAAATVGGPQLAAELELPETARTGDEVLAPELVGISGWINTEPFTLESLRGKVVLLDVWTYTCINCIRTLPYIRSWHETYADSGLVIVGVHSPEFEFEKEERNVVFAALNYDLRYPIVQDNDMETWRALDNQFWPAKYLIDRDGYIRYTHFGEGQYAETEAKIRELIEETGVSVADIPPDLEPEATIDPLARLSTDVMKHQTRELYAGFGRNYSTLQQGGAPYVRHIEFYAEPETEIEYEAPREYLNHHIYVNGLWRNGVESLAHARATESYEDYLAIMFYARTVNVVMGLEAAEPYEVRVTIDGRPIVQEHAGADIEFDDEGNSFVTVDRSDMYRLVDLPEFGGYVLKISSNSPDLAVFAYTFGSYVDQPGS